MKDDEVWFAPKRFGYGAGLPVAWQGWALLTGFIAVALGLTVALRERHDVTWAALLAIATASAAVIAARHTRGGWRWRWGDPG